MLKYLTKYRSKTHYSLYRADDLRFFETLSIYSNEFLTIKKYENNVEVELNQGVYISNIILCDENWNMYGKQTNK